MPNSVPKTLDEAKRWAAKAALGDLFGLSEPIEGQPDSYPFNATTILKVIPITWRRQADGVIAYVYHHDDLPPWMKEDAIAYQPQGYAGQ